MALRIDLGQSLGEAMQKKYILSKNVGILISDIKTLPHQQSNAQGRKICNASVWARFSIPFNGGTGHEGFDRAQRHHFMGFLCHFLRSAIHTGFSPNWEK